MKEYENLQDFADRGGHVKFFEKMLVDLWEAEGMPPDMVKELRDMFDLHEDIVVKHNEE